MLNVLYTEKNFLLTISQIIRKKEQATPWIKHDILK